jgi:hypothetical protein
MSKTKVGTPKKAFHVLINDKEYDVYDIQGKEHGGYNGEPKTWWLYYSDRLPEGLIPPHDSDNFEAWHVSIQRLVWDIRFKQKTTTKFKWDHINFRGGTWCEMWCNGKLIYEFGTTGGDRGMNFAMAKSQYLQTILCEHCYNFLSPETEDGRKIFWHGLPATIKVKSRGWEIGIVPDYTAGLEKEEWWKEYSKRTSNYSNLSEMDEQDEEMDKEFFDEGKRDDYINWGDAISDGNIYWFRK